MNYYLNKALQIKIKKLSKTLQKKKILKNKANMTILYHPIEKMKKLLNLNKINKMTIIIKMVFKNKMNWKI